MTKDGKINRIVCYRIKVIVLRNVVKLGLSSIVKIHPVVNIKEEHIPKINIWKDIEDFKTFKELVKKFEREYKEVQRLYKFKPKSNKQLESKQRRIAKKIHGKVVVQIE